MTSIFRSKIGYNRYYNRVVSFKIEINDLSGLSREMASMGAFPDRLCGRKPFYCAPKIKALHLLTLSANFDFSAKNIISVRSFTAVCFAG